MGGIWERQIRTARKISESLLKTHGASRSDKSLCFLLVEVEAFVKPIPLTTDLLSDVYRLYLLRLINLLTMKSKLVIPLSGVFLRNDIYSRKHWKRV